MIKFVQVGASNANDACYRFVKDKDMALHLLRSWYGRKIDEEVVELISLDKESSGKEFFKNLPSPP